jgi:drug/metabolite transporter (DMT)-like permease
MNLAPALLWLACVSLNTIGHLAFKQAALLGTRRPLGHGPQTSGKAWIGVGVASFMFRFFSWLALLSLVPLSKAILIVSCDIVAVMIGGRVFFVEALSIPRIVAALLIGAGVALVGVS